MKYLLLLVVTSILFTNLIAQQDTVKNEIIKYDSSIKVKTDELDIKNSKINEANQQLDSATQKVKDLNSRIQSLMNKKERTEQENENLKDEYRKLTAAIDKQQLKSRRLDTLNREKSKIVNEKDSIVRNKDSIIQLKNSEIEVKTKRVDSIKRMGDSVQAMENDLMAKRQALISKQLDSLEVIATISIRDTLRIFTNPYSTHTGSRQYYKIKEVNMTVKEGIILEIIVRTSDGIFRNKKNIIDLLHIGDAFVDKNKGILSRERQQYVKNADSLYIYLDDVINYNVIRSYRDVAYGDFEIKLLPTAQDSVYLLRESTSINTYFNIAGFTDIKGLSGDANGLAQFTADAKFITQTESIKNTALVLFHYIAFQGGLSKFDNDFKGTQLYNKDSVSRKELLQRAIYSLGVKVNLIRGFGSPSPKLLFNNLQLNIGYNFLGSRVYDTLKKGGQEIDTVFRTVTQNQYYIEPAVTLDRHHNFAITLSSPISFVSVKRNAEIKNRDWECWIRPSIALMYYGKREPGNKIFFRYNHHINLKHPTEAFSQMQMGFSVNLTEVWHRDNK